MKNHSEEIDQIIKDTLTQEEAKFYEGLDEQNLFRQMGGVFKGKNAWIIVLMNIISLIFLAFFFYCIVQLFNTDITNELILWSVGALFSALYISMIKVYFWQQMQKNNILREIKRLELQIAALSGKIR